MTLNLTWWSHPRYARDGDTLKSALVGEGSPSIPSLGMT